MTENAVYVVMDDCNCLVGVYTTFEKACMHCFVDEVESFDEEDVTFEWYCNIYKKSYCEEGNFYDYGGYYRIHVGTLN